MLEFVKHLLALNAALAGKAHAIIAYDEALARHRAGDFATALAPMREAAGLGHPAAMCLLGSMYLLGQGVGEDGREAERWLAAAVDAGYDGAVSLLGMAYATGKAGVRIDRARGRAMLEACAAKGDEQSMRMLGLMNERKGVFSTRGEARAAPSGSTTGKKAKG